MLTDSLHDFLALLACDLEMPSVGWWSPAPKDAPQNQSFRQWLRDTHGIDPLALPTLTCDATRTAHASFAAWTRSPR